MKSLLDNYQKTKEAEDRKKVDRQHLSEYNKQYYKENKDKIHTQRKRTRAKKRLLNSDIVLIGAQRWRL